jgi:hypothetical protein
MYKALVEWVDSKHMTTKIWDRLEQGWGWHQKKCEASTPVRATGYGKSGHISNPALRIKVLAKLQTAEVVNKSTQKNSTNADFPRTIHETS